MDAHGTDALTPHGAAISDLIVATFRANGRLLRWGDTVGRDLKMTSARWQVMGAIADEPRTVSQIARYFELTRQGVLWVVGALVKEGVLELIDNPAHKRAKLVRLTAYGHEIHGEIQRRQAHWANHLAADLTLEQIQAGREVLERISAAMIR